MEKIRHQSVTTINNKPTLTAKILPCERVCVGGLVDVTTPMTLKNPSSDSIFLIGKNLSP
jgi:hypothetical protein